MQNASDWRRRARDHEKENEEPLLRASFLLPAFLCAQIYIEKRKSGNDVEVQLYSKCSVLHFATDCELTIFCDWPEVRLILR